MEEDNPSMTQVGGKSKVKYAWIMLFHYSVNESEPFSIVPLSTFRDSDFPWRDVEGILSPDFRSEQRTFSNMPGKTFTIFCKIEVGKIYYYFIYCFYYRD